MTAISTLPEFFDRVVSINYDEHFSGKASLASAFNLAISLFSLRDWAIELQPRAFVSFIGAKGQTKAEIDTALERLCRGWGLVRDIANAGKHAVLKSSSKDGLARASDVSQHQRAFGEGPFGVGRFGGMHFVVVAQDGTTHDFDDVANNVYIGWQTLVDHLRRQS